MSTPLMLHLDEELQRRLEAVAKASGQELSAFARGVLRMFVEENDDFTAAVQDGVRDADAGNLVDFAEVKTELEAKMAALRSG